MKTFTDGNDFETCLMATLVPVNLCTPNLTFPNVPAQVTNLHIHQFHLKRAMIERERG